MSSAVYREDIAGDGDPLDAYGRSASERRSSKSRSGILAAVVSPLTIGLLAATIGIIIVASLKSKQTKQQDKQVVTRQKDVQSAVGHELAKEPAPAIQPREGVPVESAPPVYEQIMGGVTYEPAPLTSGEDKPIVVGSMRNAASAPGIFGTGGGTAFPTTLEAQNSFRIAANDPIEGPAGDSTNTAPSNPGDTDFITQARNANSLKFCGSLDWDYVPSAPRANGEKSIGSCYQKCIAGKEEMVIWRQIANGDPIYQYMCRRLCPEGRYDLQGFCDRALYNPEFYTTQRSIRPRAADDIYKERCGGYEPGVNRMMGPYCFWVGQSYQTKGDMRKVPITCPPTYPNEPNGPWKITNTKLSCYKCPENTKLIGDELNGYLCAEDCPDGSSDKYTGSTHQCQLDARIAVQKFADRLQ